MISINKHKQPIASVQDSVLLCPVDRHNYNEENLDWVATQTVVTVFSNKLFISFQ